MWKILERSVSNGKDNSLRVYASGSDENEIRKKFNNLKIKPNSKILAYYLVKVEDVKNFLD